MINLLDIPKRWEALPIDDLFEVVGGIPAPQDDSSYSEDGIPFVRMKDVGREHLTRSLQVTDDNLSADLVAEKKWKPIPDGSILMPRSGSVGLNHRALLTRPAIIVSHVCALVPKDRRIWSPFAYYASCQLDMRKLTKKTTGLDSLNFGDLKKVMFPLPPLDEQKRIAAILDQADELRRKRQRAIDRLNQLGQAIFHEMFGDPFSNSMNWPVAPVGELTDCIVPGRDKPKSFTGDIPWITTAEIVHLGHTLARHSKAGLSQHEVQEVRARIVPEDSVIMTCVGDLGKVSIAGAPMVINQQLHSFQCGPDINPTFLMFILSHRRNWMNRMATQTTLPYMNKTICNSVPILIPPIKLQNLFSLRILSLAETRSSMVSDLVEVGRLALALQHRAFRGEL